MERPYTRLSLNIYTNSFLYDHRSEYVYLKVAPKDFMNSSTWNEGALTMLQILALLGLGHRQCIEQPPLVVNSPILR